MVKMQNVMNRDSTITEVMQRVIDSMVNNPTSPVPGVSDALRELHKDNIAVGSSLSRLWDTLRSEALFIHLLVNHKDYLKVNYLEIDFTCAFSKVLSILVSEMVTYQDCWQSQDHEEGIKNSYNFFYHLFSRINSDWVKGIEAPIAVRNGSAPADPKMPSYPPKPSDREAMLAEIQETKLVISDIIILGQCYRGEDSSLLIQPTLLIEKINGILKICHEKFDRKINRIEFTEAVAELRVTMRYLDDGKDPDDRYISYSDRGRGYNRSRSSRDYQSQIYVLLTELANFIND